MGNNDFDFRIDQPAYVQALEIYRKMENLLEKKKEEQEESMSTTMKSWNGDAAEETAAGFSLFFQNGTYRSAYEKVKEMRILMEETLPEINTLLARCEGFIDQLKSDDYVEPVRPSAGDNTVRNGGVLSLNYDMIPKLKDACDHVVEENNALTNELAGIISSCSGLIDGTDSDLEALRAASRKINRVANYRDSFQIYESGIRALEFDMVLRLSSMSENSRSLQRELGISDTELKTGVDDLAGIYNSYMSEGEAEELTDRLKNNNDIEAMLLVAKEIFAKDTVEWTDADAYFIAQTWDYGLKNRNVAIIESYTREMFDEEYTEPELSSFLYKETDETASWVSEYRIKADTQRIQLVMNKLDPETQGEAYYTLNRFSYLTTDSIDTKGYGRFECKTGSYDVNVSVTGDVTQIEISSRVQQNRWWLPESTGVSITVCDMNEIINAEEEKILKEQLKFTAEEINLMRMSAVTDVDVEFLDKLSGRNYEQAFDVRPYGISSSTADTLTGYIMHLEQCNNTTELENMINGALMIDSHNNCCINDTSGQYITMIRANLLKYIEAENVNILCMEYDNPIVQLEREREIAGKAEEIYKQYGLWTMVDHAYKYEYGLEDIYFLEHQCRDEGTLHAEISGLGCGDEDVNGYYTFEIRIVNDNPGPEESRYVLGEQYINATSGKITGEDLAKEKIIQEISGLKEERDKIPIVAVIDGTVNLIDKEVPGASAAVSVMRFIVDGGYENLMDTYEGAMDFPYEDFIDDYESNTGVQLGLEEAQIVVGAYFETLELNRQIAEKQKDLIDIQFSQGILIDYKLCENDDAVLGEKNKYLFENDFVVGTGIILPQTTSNINKLEKEGIGAFLRDSGYEGDIDNLVNKITNALMFDENGMKLLEGGEDILEIPAEDLAGYINEINIKINATAGCKDYDLNAWLRGEN